MANHVQSFLHGALLVGEVLVLASCSGSDPVGERPADGGANGGDTVDARSAPALDGGASTREAGVATDAAAPVDFWGDTTAIPAAKNVMTFKFLNRTNGKYGDGEVYWSFKSDSINETHSVAERSTYDMPANSSGRMYFYLCTKGDAACAADPSKSKYFDFIEFTIDPSRFNGNTTRVDAFGLKLAMRLHCADGFDVAVGEDYATFLEDRAVTFQKFTDSVPAEFKPLAQPPYAPYRIVEPGAAGFRPGGAYEHYYDAFVDTIWAANGITFPKPGPNGSGLADRRDLSAAIFRHVGEQAGTFAADGTLLDKAFWTRTKTFYAADPANHYARFWHERALNGKAYGFPYDDVGDHSSYVSHENPKYMVVAIGW